VGVRERPTRTVEGLVTDRMPVVRARCTPADARRLVAIAVAITQMGAGLDAAVRALPEPVPARRGDRDGWAAGAGQGARDGHCHDCPPLAASPVCGRPAPDRGGAKSLRHRHHPDACRGTPPRSLHHGGGVVRRCAACCMGGNDPRNPTRSPTDRAASAGGVSGGSALGSPSPCGRCGGDASDRRAVTGEGLHPLRTLPHPAPPPWLHEQIIAAIVSEAERRRTR